jgi:hypothetical protein
MVLWCRQHKWMGFAPQEATLIQIVGAVCTLHNIEHVRRPPKITYISFYRPQWWLRHHRPHPQSYTTSWIPDKLLPQQSSWCTYQETGSLTNFFRDKAVDVSTKKLIFVAIPVNTVLHGCEYWVLKTEHTMRKLGVCYHHLMWRIFGIYIQRVEHDRIKNEEHIHKKINVTGIIHTIRLCQFNWLGKLASQPNSSCLHGFSQAIVTERNVWRSRWIKHTQRLVGLAQSHNLFNVISIALWSWCTWKACRRFPTVSLFAFSVVFACSSASPVIFSVIDLPYDGLNKSWRRCGLYLCWYTSLRMPFSFSFLQIPWYNNLQRRRQIMYGWFRLFEEECNNCVAVVHNYNLFLQSSHPLPSIARN